MPMNEETVKRIRENFASLEEELKKPSETSNPSDHFLQILFSPHFDCIPLGEIYEILAKEYLKKTGGQKTPGQFQGIIKEIIKHKSWSDRLEHLKKTLGEQTYLEDCTWFVFDLYVDLYLFEKREEIKKCFSWADEQRRAGHRKAIVNAPMGLGKTYQLAEAIARSTYSAVIFMPTIPLRDEMYAHIRSIVPGQVHKIEGRDEINCKNFDLINAEKRRFRENKLAICAMCPRKREESCITRIQKAGADKYRLLVTTHAQYEGFYHSEDLYKWSGKNGMAVTRYERIPRDFFVIDEDIVGTHFFECAKITHKEFCDYKGLLEKTRKRKGKAYFPSGFPEKVRRLYDAIENAAQENALILPIDPAFNLTKEERQGFGSICGKALSKNKLSKNITRFVENAIRIGCSFSHYNETNIIYFNEISEFPLVTDRPFHLFFDATHVREDLLAEVFPEKGGSHLPRYDIPIVPLGDLTIYHTNNSDVPKNSKGSRHDEKIELYLKNILLSNARRRSRYFIVTTGSKKKPDEGYRGVVARFLRRFHRGIELIDDSDEEDEGEAIRERFPFEEEKQLKGYNYAVLNNFGNLRGSNKAKYCDVGILIGKFKVPDAVEVAWAIPFLKDVLNTSAIREEDWKNGFFPIRADNKLSPGVGMSHKITNEEGVEEFVYRKDFDFVNGICRWKRITENEQAIGRTRFLHHDVTFYVVTKDPMDGSGFFRYPEKVHLFYDDDGIAIFGDNKGSYRFFVQRALDRLLHPKRPENIGKGQVQFKIADVQAEIAIVMHYYGAEMELPADRTVSDHMKHYLAQFYPHVTPDRYGVYTVSLSSPKL